MSRKKTPNPTKAMRARAWKALAGVIDDPEAAAHAKVSAARLIVRDDKADDAAEPDKRPPGCVFMPDDRRNPGLTPLGITDIDRQVVVIFDDTTEQGRADCERWKLEMNARIEIDYPPERLALPAPAPKPKLSWAERKRAYRARIKAAGAAKAAA